MGKIIITYDESKAYQKQHIEDYFFLKDYIMFLKKGYEHMINSCRKDILQVIKNELNKYEFERMISILKGDLIYWLMCEDDDLDDQDIFLRVIFYADMIIRQYKRYLKVVYGTQEEVKYIAYKFGN